MQALAVSTALVALAEMGDKTQLLSFVLAAKLRRPWPIIAGIFVSTLGNHFLAGWIGAWLATLLAPQALKWIIAVSFFAFGLWALKADTFDGEREYSDRSVFITTLIAFFWVEMGDKTQLATVALAARFDALIAVVMGTTLGMLIANAPAVWIGEAFADRVNMKAMRWIAAGLFFLLGALTLIAGERL
jgi:putative Ca2+/H+ antiporter (TMEM165/GDT1 family)